MKDPILLDADENVLEQRTGADLHGPPDQRPPDALPPERLRHEHVLHAADLPHG
jgi:hypothetical protein